MQEKYIDLLEFCFSSDLEFYEKHLADLPLEEQAAFMNEFPEFLDFEMNVKNENITIGSVYQILRV